MDSFISIGDLIRAVETGDIGDNLDPECSRRILEDNPKALDILRKIEETGQWKQEYFLFKDALLSTYIHEEPILGPLRFRIRIFGFPGMDKPGYLLPNEGGPREEEMPEILAEAADSLKGISVVVDITRKIYKSPPFKDNMIFRNHFSTFEDYMSALRSKYRRDRAINLKKSGQLSFVRLEEDGFTQSHYELYLRVYKRAKEKLDRMPFEYFKTFEKEIFEIRNLEGELLAFIQLRELEAELHFLYVGFSKDEAEAVMAPPLRSVDIYFDILVFILQHGIEKGFEKIVFGPTTEEAKAKIGCVRETRYIYITAGDPIRRFFLRNISPFFFKGEEQARAYSVFKVDGSDMR